MKIAFVVPGRFHVFDLARELLKKGHEVTVFTNYPRWAAGRFGVPRRNVRSFWLHGVIARAAERICRTFSWDYPEVLLLRWFGRWAAEQVERQEWVVVNCMSGSAEEVFRKATERLFLRQVTRLSSHIRLQREILEEEERRVGMRIVKPSAAMVAREEREYSIADQIHVPSRFAQQSFTERGIPPGRLRIVPLGVRLDDFRPSQGAVEARHRRILSGSPLRALYVGAISLRKGMWDLAEVVRSVDPGRFRFRLIGPLDWEAAPLLRGLKGRVERISSQPQRELPRWYAWGDLFVFPTLEDGYAMVLAQAFAGGLPLVVTRNCGGPDFIREGESGWVVPIRRPDLIAERLRWCDAHRQELAEMALRLVQSQPPPVLDWAEVAADFEAVCAAGIAVLRKRP